MNRKEIETTARNPSVGADGGQPSKTYTPISAETAFMLIKAKGKTPSNSWMLWVSCW